MKSNIYFDGIVFKRFAFQVIQDQFLLGLFLLLTVHHFLCVEDWLIVCFEGAWNVYLFPIVLWWYWILTMQFQGWQEILQKAEGLSSNLWTETLQVSA